MAIYSLNHKYIGKMTHPPRVASDHLRYVLRKSACDEVIAANMPVPKIGSRGGKTRAWLEEQEDNTRKNGRVIDKIMVALPRELDQAQRVELIKAFVADITGGEETFWLAALHDQNSPNPHAHMIFRDQGVHTGKRVIEFSERDSTRRLRERWEVVTNAYFAKHGIEAHIDHRSLKAQRKELLLKAEWELNNAEHDVLLKTAEELNRKPSGHDGPELRALEKKGKTSYKLERLRELREGSAQKQASDTRKEDEPASPTLAKIKELLKVLHDATAVSSPGKDADQLNVWWDARFAKRAAQAGMMIILSTIHPTATLIELEQMVDGHVEDINTNPDNQLQPYWAALAGLGQAAMQGQWRALKPLAQIVANHSNNDNWIAAELAAIDEPEETSPNPDETEQPPTSDVEPHTEVMQQTTPMLPDPALIEELLAKVQSSETPLHRSSEDQETETQIDAWWNQACEKNHEHAGMIALLSLTQENATFTKLDELANRLIQSMDNDEGHLLQDHRIALASLGSSTLAGGWRRINSLAKAIELYKDKDTWMNTAVAEDTSTNSDDAETSSPPQDRVEMRRSQQETRVEEKARRAAEKTLKRAEEKIERSIQESRKRVLRGRKLSNTLQGAFRNIRSGTEMLTPYPQDQLRAATDKFFAATKWLINVWDAYRNGKNPKPDFEREERNYIEASADLTEMHLVVPKPAQLTGEELIGEQARLQELQDFQDQALINPVMGSIKRRLKQVVAYLTETEDGKAKAEDVAAKKRQVEADRQQAWEQEQRTIAERHKKWEEQDRLSTAMKVIKILKRGAEDADVDDIIVSYNLDTERTPDEIAYDPFWRGYSPGSKRMAWYDLEQRVEALDENRKRISDIAKLKKLSGKIEYILDRAEVDPEIERLIREVQTHRWLDRQDILEDMEWLEPVRKDEHGRPLWEVAFDRIKQLDKATERQKERECNLKEQQKQKSKLPKPPSPLDDDPSF